MVRGSSGVTWIAAYPTDAGVGSEYGTRTIMGSWKSPRSSGGTAPSSMARGRAAPASTADASASRARTTISPGLDAAEVTPEQWELLSELERFADARGISLLELALGGLLSMPGVGMLFVGATTPQQVGANADAVRWVPSADDVAELTNTGDWTNGRVSDLP